jgi:hypothetical protein
MIFPRDMSAAARTSYHIIRSEMAVSAGDDPWGWCMGWWFAVAGRLHDDGGPVPAGWHYRPSPFGGGGADPDAYEDDTLAELRPCGAALIHAGNVLSRYASRVRRAGLDY